MNEDRRRIAARAAIVMMWATNPLWPQVKSGVLGSSHDVQGHGCKSCHAPHNGAVALTPGADPTTGEVLLWDRAFSNVTFGVYASPTMNRQALEAGGLPLSRTESRAYTLLCLSCHDGVTTTGVVAPVSAKVGSPTQSDGLRNDHPVNVSWNHQTLAGGLPSCSNCHFLHGGGEPLLPFFGGYVQCASCHDPHTRVNEKFLRITNTNSAICRFCHG